MAAAAAAAHCSHRHGSSRGKRGQRWRRHQNGARASEPGCNASCSERTAAACWSCKAASKLSSCRLNRPWPHNGGCLRETVLRRSVTVRRDTAVRRWCGSPRPWSEHADRALLTETGGAWRPAIRIARLRHLRSKRCCSCESCSSTRTLHLEGAVNSFFFGGQGCSGRHRCSSPHGTGVSLNGRLLALQR